MKEIHNRKIVVLIQDFSGKRESSANANWRGRIGMGQKRVLYIQLLILPKKESFKSNAQADSAHGYFHCLSFDKNRIGNF